MAHSLSQTLSQQLRMEQRLTPQLIQSMAILQKPITELEAHVEDALESNAALEQDETTDQPADAAREDWEERSDDDSGSFARLYRMSRDYDMEGNDRAPSRTHRLTGQDGWDSKMGAMANTVGRQTGLHEQLLEQWSLVDIDDEVRRAGEAIIHHLDPDGYLRVRLEQIADSVRPPLSRETLERVLGEVQKLDPAGVAARDVVECLLLQLDTLPGDNSLERRLIQNHLDDLSHNRLPAIAREIDCTIGEINEAMKAMRSHLCLHPGYLVGDRSVPPIRPDVIVEYAGSGGGLTIRLTRGNIPKLRVRDEVVALAKSRDNGKDDREFARKHVESAVALIDAIRFRQQRVLQVARAIVEKQREFFDVGPEALKVLRMSDLAVELECDPSTISRAVADKYIQTPRGIYPLRYFFTGGMETNEGESVGWDRVKTRARELIDAEDKSDPLNDDQIAALLKQEGIEISRRTVAKYRSQMNIPSTRQRRKF